MRVVVRAFADREASDAVAWYTERNEQVASQFVDRLAAVWRLLSDSPRAGTAIDSAHRRLLVHGFPFAVIYRVTPNAVIVVAVAHTSREPGYWRGRR